MKMQQNQLGRMKPILQMLLQKKAKPAAALAARALCFLQRYRYATDLPDESSERASE